MADKLANVEESLNLTKTLRSTVTSVFQDLTSNPSIQKEGDSSGSNKSPRVAECLKKNLAAVQKILSDLDKSTLINTKSDSHPVPLGNTGLLTLDPVEDKTYLYNQLIDGYDWTGKLTAQAGQALSNLKRQHPCASTISDGASAAKKSYKELPSAKGELHRLIQELKSPYPELRFQLSQACGSTVLEVTIPKTLKADIVLRGTGVDQVIVHGLQEKASLLHKKDTLNVQSKYAVFRTITDYANAATMHFYTVSGPELQQLQRILKWLDSFRGLFSLKCKKCKLHLKEDTERIPLPPCWRNYSDFSPYHFQCKP